MRQGLRTVVLALALTVVTPAGHGRAAVPAGPAAAGRIPPQPNIVVLMADDLDDGSFRDAVRAGLLPHISRLFARGTDFRQSFVSESFCSPSRATFLTGLYPHNHGVFRNSGAHGGFPTFMRDFADDNLGPWIHAAGYRTAHVGKFLNGYLDGTVVPPGWDEWQALVGPSTYCMYGYDLSNNGRPVHHGQRVADYQTDVLAGLAESFILDSRAQGSTQPLFLSVAPLAPHRERFCGQDGVRPAPRHVRTPPLPFPKPPSFDEADMSDKPAWMQALPPVDEARMSSLYNQRIASMRAVDDLLGRVVRALRAVGEMDRTAFVFASDNGYLLGRHRWEAKTLVYEESIRVPLLMRVPGLAAPRTVDEIVLNNDLAPTIADLAGATPGHVTDGRSLLPLLKRTATSWRRRFLVEYPPALASEAADDPDAEPVPPLIPPFLAVRSGADGDLSDLVHAQTLSALGGVRDEELYDLAVDPFQLASRHDDPAYAVKLRRLRQHLDELTACGNGTCPALEDEE